MHRLESAAAEAEADAQMDEALAESTAATKNKNPLPTSQHSVLSSPHSGPILCVRWSASGDYLLSGGQDRGIHLWNPTKSKHIKSYAGAHGREVADVQLNSTNERFASGGGDKTLFLWDVQSGEVIRRMRGHEGKIQALAWNEDDGVLASASFDATVRLWDIRAFSRDAIQTLAQAKDSVSSVRIRGAEVTAAGMDGCVRRYDIRMGRLVTDHIGVPLSHATWSHDGECLLLSCLDNTRKLLDRTSGQVLNEYKGAPSKEFAMEACFDNSDAFVLAGGEDGAIRAWDLVTAKEVHRWDAHTAAVSSIAYHPKAKAFASASVDGTIRYWK